MVLPFSSDPFSNAADLKRIGAAGVLPPNEATAADLALAIDVGRESSRSPATAVAGSDCLVDTVFGWTRDGPSRDLRVLDEPPAVPGCCVALLRVLRGIDAGASCECGGSTVDA